MKSNVTKNTQCSDEKNDQVLPDANSPNAANFPELTAAPNAADPGNVANPACAASKNPTPDPFTQRIHEMAPEIEPYVIEKRRFFHAYPELSGKEINTTMALAAELEEIGVPYVFAKDVIVGDECESGLIATISGEAPGAYDADGKPRHCVALRADIDALPIKEQTNAPYTSQNDNIMHACGHDCHMAMMLGTVRMLHALRHELKGEVRIIFQPAEEISIGSRKMIKAGALDGVESIYGAHIWSEVDAGMVSIEAGPRMANTDWFRVDVSGSSAHGAMPHKGVDAIVVGAAIIDALQVVVSRDTSPFAPVVLTIGEFHGGVARNVMAGTAYLAGTVRSFDSKVRDFLRARMEYMVNRVAESYGATADFEWQTGNSALVNDEVCAQRARRSAEKVLGEQALAHYEGTLSGEDFSEYLRFVPGVFVFVGGRNPEIGANHPQHSCFYDVDERVLINGSMLAAQYAYDFLSEE